MGLTRLRRRVITGGENEGTIYKRKLLPYGQNTSTQPARLMPSDTSAARFMVLWTRMSALYLKRDVCASPLSVLAHAPRPRAWGVTAAHLPKGARGKRANARAPQAHTRDKRTRATSARNKRTRATKDEPSSDVSVTVEATSFVALAVLF